MTSICRGLKVGEGKSWAAVTIAVTLGTTTPADCMARRKVSGVTDGD